NGFSVRLERGPVRETTGVRRRQSRAKDNSPVRSCTLETRRLACLGSYTCELVCSSAPWSFLPSFLEIPRLSSLRYSEDRLSPRILAANPRSPSGFLTTV